MWILESRGDFFQGRRMWLKPGKQYLFGRVKKDGVRFALDNKTVSRKHFIIDVDNVQESEIGNVHARTVVTITDQGSKTGTLVNGERTKEPRVLTRSENIIKLGTCSEELVVKWEPVVLTFNLLKKEIRSGLLRLKQRRVKDLDIKAISDFVPGTSSFLVVGKRNTAKGLQALIDGKPLVDESYIDALEYAATPTELDEEENLSPLELDYDSAWPRAAEHLPPQSKEPTSRSARWYEPDPARAQIFENYTFVFGDQTQYDNLLPPITTGHGKAILFPVVSGETSSDELVAFMRAAAGRKGFGDAHKDADNGAVIMVRWTSKGYGEWTNELINQVALGLDQRAIEQGEFLDAILANNAISLRQAVPSDSVPTATPIVSPSTAETTTASSQPLETHDRALSFHAGREVKGSEMFISRRSVDVTEEMAHPSGISSVPVKKTEASSPVKAFRFSPPRKTQPTGFDDDFDENAIIPYQEDEEGVFDSESCHDPQNDSLVRSRLSSEDASEGEAVTQGPPNPKKRPRSSTQEELYVEEGGDNLDAMLPGISNLKRRKFARTVAAEQQLQAKLKRGGVVLPVPKPRSMKEVNVKEELRAKREADKQRAQQAGGDEDEQPIEYDENGNLPVYEVVTECMDLPMRKQTTSEKIGAVSDRWDPRWNGRPNFKAFRRAREQIDGNTSTRREHHARLIVPLVDAKQVTYGIGDQYWDRTEEDKERDRERKRRASQRTTQSQTNSSHRQVPDDPNQEQLMHGPESGLTEGDDNSSIHELSGGNAQPDEEGLELANGEVGPPESRRTRLDNQRSEDRLDGQAAMQNHSSRGSGKAVKRPASQGSGITDKRQKTLSITSSLQHGSDSDDSDDMKFKFGRGRRGRGRGRGRF